MLRGRFDSTDRLLGVHSLSQLYERLALEAGAEVGIIHLHDLTEFERPIPLVELRDALSRKGRVPSSPRPCCVTGAQHWAQTACRAGRHQGARISRSRSGAGAVVAVWAAGARCHVGRIRRTGGCPLP